MSTPLHRGGEIQAPAPLCLMPKLDASPHAPNGTDHTLSFFTFFPGAVFRGEGKQFLDRDGT